MGNFPIVAEAADCVATGIRIDGSAEEGWFVEGDCRSLQVVTVCTATPGTNSVLEDMHRGLQVRL